MKYFITALNLLLTIFVCGQDSNYSEQEVSISKWIEGTLLRPNNSERPPLAIIIAGSGPTDRDGNQNFMKNNALKKLAVALVENDIATFRYDKRVVKQIRTGNIDANTLFDDFVSDAKDVVTHFKSSTEFDKIIVIGHSQGSLVGMLASKTNTDAFISLAGAGQNIGDVIVGQIAKTAPMFNDDAERIVSELKKGNTVKDYPQALSSVFNTDLQDFMINWMSYNPSEEIKTLDIPVLLINGTKDLQVAISEAESLSKSNPKAKLVIVDDMNHVLFNIEGGDLENAKSYNEGNRSISEALVSAVVDFIKDI